MKNSIIIQLGYGLRGMTDDMKCTEAEQEFQSIANKATAELKKELTPSQKELLIKLSDAYFETTCAASESYYQEGFKLGLLIGIECMEE